MNIRIILAISIVVCSAFSGKAFAAAAQKRAALINEMIEGLRLLRIYMTGMMEDVSRALMQTGNKILNIIGEEMTRGGNAAEAWKNVSISPKFQNIGLNALKREERDVIERLFARLGESDRESQKVLIESCIKALEDRLPEARKKAVEAEKTYAMLGFLIGIIIALVVV